jgi:cysteine desulfurase
MKPYWTIHFGNPSSTHSLGQRANMAVQRARAQMARLLNANPEQMVFTSGATESIHSALIGWTLAQKEPCHIITSTIEHKATYGACQFAQKLGARVSFVPVQSDGTVDFKHLESLIKSGEATLVSLIHGNNEIGTLQKIDDLAKQLAQLSRVFLHVDAAQSVGKIKIDLATTKIDFLSLSGHKIYGPKGVGGLYIRDASSFEPLFSGGGQEMNLRAGTHNVTGIVGLGKACEWFFKNSEKETERLSELQKLFFSLLKPLGSKIQIHGSMENRLPNNINFSLTELELEKIAAQFEDFAFSSGSACSSEAQTTSHVLKALNIPESIAKNTFRIGLGLHTQEKEVRAFCQKLSSVLNTSPTS